MGAPAGPASDSADTLYSSRVTRDGRRLFYRLQILQQPERARACGSGPKSSADRRPVDPPPVVELRIFEGSSPETGKDITFTYNANFFLFATLEQARIMAHGRGSQGASNNPPVLTGVPVAGLAYLDRPHEAGYFLFPDLSVRHEGRYRLTFSLYEQTKEERDMDPETESKSATGSDMASPDESFVHRMDVQSHDFIVWSAKKFPGLTESTALSRVVAEQGCRVRIRRDVRMRRREGKGSGSADNNEDEFARQRRTQTPEQPRDPYRSRSMSNDSGMPTPYSADGQRRTSGAGFPPPPQGALPSQAPPSGSFLQFGNSTASQPSMPAPSHAPSTPTVPQSPSYPQHPNGSFSQPSSYPPPPTPGAYSYGERPGSQDSRRSSTGYVQLAEPKPRAVAPAPLPAPHKAASFSQLPPIMPATSPVPSHQVQHSAPITRVASLLSPVSDRPPQRANTFDPTRGPLPSASTLPRPTQYATVPTTGKRRHDEMSQRYDETERYHNRAREDIEKHVPDYKNMQYRRADDRVMIRRDDGELLEIMPPQEQ